MHHPRALSSLILGYVLATLVVTMVLGFALYTQVTRDLLDRYSEGQALSVAEAVAATAVLRDASGRAAGLTGTTGGSNEARPDDMRPPRCLTAPLTESS